MSPEKRLTVVLVLNLLLVAALVIAGLSAHSLGVLAAGGDYLADAAAIGVSLFAIWVSRRPPSARRPGGFPNATNIAALVNGGWLLVLNVLIVVAAIRRLVSGAPRVEGLPVLIVSAVAALVMLTGAFILGGDIDEGEDEDLNMKAVLLDTAADAAAAGGVAISGAVILAAGGLYWMDPAVALIIAVVVGYHALRLIRKVAAAIKSSAHPGPGGGPQGVVPRPQRRPAISAGDFPVTTGDTAILTARRRAPRARKRYQFPPAAFRRQLGYWLQYR